MAFSNSARCWGERRSFGFSCSQLGLGAGNVEIVANASVKAAPDQSHLFLSQINRAGHGGDFGIECPEPEIILRDVSLQSQQDIANAASEPCASARALSNPRRTRPHSQSRN